MASVRPLRPVEREPVGLHTQAMDNIRFIRRTMESAAAFTAVPGKSGGLVGVTPVGAAGVGGKPTRRGPPPPGWVGAGGGGGAGGRALGGGVCPPKKEK